MQVTYAKSSLFLNELQIGVFRQIDDTHTHIRIRGRSKILQRGGSYKSLPKILIAMPTSAGVYADFLIGGYFCDHTQNTPTLIS